VSGFDGGFASRFATIVTGRFVGGSAGSFAVGFQTVS
jgi:hypothetical protein